MRKPREQDPRTRWRRPASEARPQCEGASVPGGDEIRKLKGWLLLGRLGLRS